VIGTLISYGKMHVDQDDLVPCLEKKRRWSAILWSSRQRYRYDLFFGDQDTIEGVITLKIDSRTIKRGIFGAIDHLSATR
jgi:hypothetical protein